MEMNKGKLKKQDGKSYQLQASKVRSSNGFMVCEVRVMKRFFSFLPHSYRVANSVKVSNSSPFLIIDMFFQPLSVENGTFFQPEVEFTYKIPAFKQTPKQQ